MKKPKLVPNWKRCLTWYSSHINIALASIAPVWVALPEEWRQAVPPMWLAIAASILGILGFVGRLIDQGAKNDSA